MIERKRSLSPLKDSPRSITSESRSPVHSVFSRETKDSNEASPVSATVLLSLIKLMVVSVDGEGTISYPWKG